MNRTFERFNAAAQVGDAYGKSTWSGYEMGLYLPDTLFRVERDWMTSEIVEQVVIGRWNRLARIIEPEKGIVNRDASFIREFNAVAVGYYLCYCCRGWGVYLKRDRTKDDCPICKGKGILDAHMEQADLILV